MKKKAEKQPTPYVSHSWYRAQLKKMSMNYN